MVGDVRELLGSRSSLCRDTHFDEPTHERTAAHGSVARDHTARVLKGGVLGTCREDVLGYPLCYHVRAADPAAARGRNSERPGASSDSSAAKGGWWVSSGYEGCQCVLVFPPPRDRLASMCSVGHPMFPLTRGVADCGRVADHCPCSSRGHACGFPAPDRGDAPALWVGLPDGKDAPQHLGCRIF